MSKGSVITVNQSQYEMVKGQVSSFQDIYISSGKETSDGDIYIIPFIPNNYYWYGSGKAQNHGSWTFELGNIDSEDIILIDYPVGDFINSNSSQLDELWDISKIFEVAHCIWIDGYYEGDPLVSNGYNTGPLFPNGFYFGDHPESIELAWGDFSYFDSSQFGLIDLSQLDLNTITNLSAKKFKKNYSNEITSKAQIGEFITGNNSEETIIGSNLNDFIFGLDRNDKISGRDGGDRILGGEGGDSLYGDSGGDILYGGKGKDILNGGKGNDILSGGKGKDKLIGGNGKDIFKLSKGRGYDLIQDFKDKQDKIYIGSMKKLKLKNKGSDVYVYMGKDLLAKVKGAKGDLSKKGKFII